MKTILLHLSAAMLAVALVAGFILVAVLAGCGPTIPPLVESSTPSFDGKVQDSGVISLVPGGQLVTPHWRDRYNGMIATYGKRFTPPLKTDDGIMPAGPGAAAAGVPAGTAQYFIDNEHAVKFDQMNDWRKADMAAVTAPKISTAPPAKTKPAAAAPAVPSKL